MGSGWCSTSLMYGRLFTSFSGSISKRKPWLLTVLRSRFPRSNGTENSRPSHQKGTIQKKSDCLSGNKQCRNNLIVKKVRYALLQKMGKSKAKNQQGKPKRQSPKQLDGAERARASRQPELGWKMVKLNQMLMKTKKIWRNKK